MPTFTPHYNLAMPLVNSPTDADLWGGELNNNMNIIDATMFSNSQGDVPSGTVLDFAGSSAPTGYLLCYGQTELIATYPVLNGILGTKYGGDGITTFGIPDCRGRASFGQDNMGGTPASRITTGVAGFDGTVLGAAGGDQNLYEHTHPASVTDTGHDHASSGGNFLVTTGGLAYATGGGTSTGQAGTTASATTGITVANANAGTGVAQNVPPAIIFNKIIKT